LTVLAEDSVRLGVAYYPEQWPRDRWRTDARMMAEAGLTLARVGEFAWSALEPEPGRFELDWLDEAIGILDDAGIEVVVGTPTATPPAWLIESHPEVQPVDIDGHRHRFGNRRHYCPNQPAYHEATERVVDAQARRFGRDRRVIGWQIDNEFGGYCYCNRCRACFHEWLRERYATLEQLNQAWGTAFWSQTYTKWEQIPVPQREPLDPNPALALEYRRFMSDSYVRYQSLQATCLRKHTRDQFLTHNFMGFKFPEIDYGRLAADLDLVSWDNYPGLDPQATHLVAALGADAMRGLKQKKTWVMEQQAGPVGWGTMVSPAPRQVRLWTYQALAHGAEAVLYFRWRTARFGTEQHWHGILDADGTARRRYRDLQAMSAELGRFGHLLHAASPRADVALIQDYDSRFALQVQPTNEALGYEATVLRHYQALRGLGLGVDVLPNLDAVRRYRLVVAPSLYICDPQTAVALARFVEDGGVLVLAPRTAVKDRFNAAPERPLPVGLDDLCGIRVSDYQSVAADRAVRVEGGSLEGEFRGWYEELDVAGAETLAAYADGPFAGSPAITSHRYGNGRAVYVAGAATDVTLERVYRHLGAGLGLTMLELPFGLEAVRLEGTGNGELMMLLNHTDRAQRLVLEGRRWHDHVSAQSGDGAIELDAYDVALIEGVR
jgi:beta-galactosidase